jgi:hypothetical protein
MVGLIVPPSSVGDSTGAKTLPLRLCSGVMFCGVSAASDRVPLWVVARGTSREALEDGTTDPVAFRRASAALADWA